MQRTEADHRGLNGPSDSVDHVGQDAAGGSERGGHWVEVVDGDGGGDADVLGVEAGTPEPAAHCRGGELDGCSYQTVTEAAGGGEEGETDGLDAVGVAGVADGGEENVSASAAPAAAPLRSVGRAARLEGQERLMPLARGGRQLGLSPPWSTRHTTRGPVRPVAPQGLGGPRRPARIPASASSRTPISTPVWRKPPGARRDPPAHPGVLHAIIDRIARRSGDRSGRRAAGVTRQ